MPRPIFLGGQTQASAETATQLARPASRGSRDIFLERVNAARFGLDCLRLFCGAGDFQVLQGWNLKVEVRCMNIIDWQHALFRHFLCTCQKAFSSFFGRVVMRIDLAPKTGRKMYVLHDIFEIFEISEI